MTQTSAMRPAMRNGRGGFTLMELMVTMAIAASLLGLGAGLFVSMGKRSASESALANVSSLVVNVRNSSSRFPAMIRVDPEANAIQGMAQEVRQELHFDPRVLEGREIRESGIENTTCEMGTASIEPNAGRVGGAARLGGGKIDCGNYAAYDVTDGLSVELWIKPDANGSADLVTKGDAFRLRLEPGNHLSATIGVRDDHGVTKVANTVSFPPVRPGQWLGIKATYDCNTLQLFTDNGHGWMPRGTPKAETRRLTISRDANLFVGGFAGLLDDFRFAGVHATPPVPLPDGVHLVGKSPRRPIHFLGGRLDPSIHMGAETIAMDSPGKRTLLQIDRNGMMSVSYGEPGAAAPESKGPDRAPPPKKE
jgi:prepilin-type N-terminal cleavage/methylation domain-containing protein